MYLSVAYRSTFFFLKTFSNSAEVTASSLLASLPVCYLTISKWNQGVQFIGFTDWKKINVCIMHKEGKEMFCLRVIFSMLNTTTHFQGVSTSKCRLCCAEGCRIWSVINIGNGKNYLQPCNSHCQNSEQKETASFGKCPDFYLKR